MRSWVEVDRDDPRVVKAGLLDCMWVYCKARLVVRGDQQRRGQAEETCAATLAGRSFRSLMAIAARFDLELLQYDAVNAFVNAKLPTGPGSGVLGQGVFMRMPPAHRTPGKVLHLQKALYGLRHSPLLWQKEFSSTLRSLGFTPVPHEPCCFMKGGVIIFFYVDDIVVAFRKGQAAIAPDLIQSLQSRYKLTGGAELQWFLGIEIVRDRSRGLIWLSQSSYVEKIARLAERTDLAHTVPMSSTELLPREQAQGRALPHEVNRFQRKIGSLLYAAVTTRPDIAFAVSRLARFNTNPSHIHQAAADRVLLYLQRTKGLALQFGGADDLLVASDASFADNTLDRKSSQGYAMKLFGGLIGWRANKQDTVTTSTTEAELLALAQAAKESLFVSRLLTELSVRLDDNKIRIQCDNQQTIRLVTTDVGQLQTKLRHVDIHNHWLRQEVSANRIAVEYTPSKEMIADGLTKSLQASAFDDFVGQLGLVDISDRLESRVLDEYPDVDDEYSDVDDDCEMDSATEDT